MKGLDKHPCLIYMAELQEICRPLKKLGITYFSHTHYNEKFQVSRVSTNPEFLKHYFEQAYYNYDAHLSCAESDERYILWDLVEHTKGTKRLYEDLINFGQAHVFTIIQKFGDQIDSYHFATKKSHESINCLYLQHLNWLKEFILYFKDKIHAHKELCASYDFKFETDFSQAGYFTRQNLTPSIPETKQAMNINRVYLDVTKQRYLTRREYECLYWLSQGKTAEQISLILGVTLRTIKAHMHSMRLKLGCVNQFQLGLLYSRLKNLVDIEK